MSVAHWTIDFETYYDTDYSLSKLSTTAYIRSAQFETILASVIPPDKDPFWLPGPEFARWIEVEGRAKIANAALLAHHAHFDGAILNWHYDTRPRLWLDTLSMSRYVLGGTIRSHALSAIAEHFGVGKKGDEVINAKGKHLSDFSEQELKKYGEYSINDSMLTAGIFSLLKAGVKGVMEFGSAFPQEELLIIDKIIRMFTEPKIELDRIQLAEYYEYVTKQKEALLNRLPHGRTAIMSNTQFAKLLSNAGVVPPTKISPTTGKQTYAFAKTDQGFLNLLDHPSLEVQTLAAVRLGVKSTIEETRTRAFLDIAQSPTLPVYLNYCGAQQTNRLSGGDAVNLQNLKRKGVLRASLTAPDGMVFVVVDSSNIEARVVDTLAGESEAIDAYRAYDAGAKVDIYCYMASKLYGRPISPADAHERQLGKITKLGCGFGIGADKYIKVVKQWGITISDDEGVANVALYRQSHKNVVNLWNACDRALPSIQMGVPRSLDHKGLLQIVREGIRLPSGFVIKYHKLTQTCAGEWEYVQGRLMTYIYGGKIVENVVQALARDIVLWQSLQTIRQCPAAHWVHSVHDEGVFLVPEKEAGNLLETALRCFKQPPPYWPELPLNAHGGIARTYGAVDK